MSSLGGPPPPHVTEQAWKQHMIQLHNKEAPKKRSRAPRGGIKRKRSSAKDEEELVWSLERLLQSQREEGERRRQQRCVSGGEEDACALDYLHLRYNGNVRAAEMNLLVDLSAGRGKLVFNYCSCCLREENVQSTTSA
jgi:hypothetical protein